MGPWGGWIAPTPSPPSPAQELSYSLTYFCIYVYIYCNNSYDNKACSTVGTLGGRRTLEARLTKQYIYLIVLYCI